MVSVTRVFDTIPPSKLKELRNSNNILDEINPFHQCDKPSLLLLIFSTVIDGGADTYCQTLVSPGIGATVATFLDLRVLMMLDFPTLG